jgi:hypothetical protein
LVSGIGYPIPDFEVSGISIGIGFEDFGIGWYPIPETIPRILPSKSFYRWKFLNFIPNFFAFN